MPPTAHDPIKVYDARWEADEFDDAAVTRLFVSTLLYARELEVDTLTLTRDTRLGVGRLMELGCATALRMGFRVYLCTDPISTPQSYFTTMHVLREHPKTMGLTLTASHNPKAYVGIKFTVPPVQAIGYDCGPRGGLARVREIYHSSAKGPDAAGGSLHLVDLAREYVSFSLQAAGVGDGGLGRIGVVLDSFHGAAGPEVYTALTRAGALVIPRRLVPDGNFPTGSPNPTSQGKMTAAVEEAARAEKAHPERTWVAIGIDGDGDRIVFGSARGTLTAGFAFVPILRACLGLAQAAPGVTVLYDPKVSPLALAEWGRLGAKPVLFRNGHSQIKDYMTRVSALAAAEESGHYYHRIEMGDLAVAGENSILTILLFLGALQKDPGLLEQLSNLQDRVFTTGEFNYQFESDAVRDQALDAVVRHFVAEGASTVTATPDGIDLQGTCLARGVHVDPGSARLDDGWYSGYLRVATNEKGVVRSYFSAGETAAGSRVEKDARRILEKEFRGVVVD